MNCVCGKETNKELEKIADFCTGCFCNHVEKKVKKTLRYADIKKNDKVLLINDKTQKGVINEFLFKSIIKGLPIQLVIKDKLDENGFSEFDKIILQDSLDDASEKILIDILNANANNESTKFIRLLENLSEKEIEAYAIIKNISYEKAYKKSHILTIFDKVEEKYPGSKLSFTKAIKELRQL